ncbi:2Fe-2S iron-sulfur cluster binding domain-containing protein [Halalkalibacter kiskunsagensis]|uniref:2Fe-2S iron-sulfur cluster binding domain-containing protein n=1 Tax=Halalkalibacter kiskunsagensis TaxID=1548599 RepID=A0ABV6KGA9_9BACI
MRKSNVYLNPIKNCYKVSADKELLQSLIEQGVELEFQCHFGSCRMCVVRLVNGQVYHHQVPGITDEEREEGYILLCSSKPRSEVLEIERIYP